MTQDAPSAVCSTSEQSLLQTQPDSLDFFAKTRATHISVLRGAQLCPHVSTTLEANAYTLMSRHKEGCAVAACWMHCEKWVHAASLSRQPGIISSNEVRCLQVQAAQLRITPNEMS